MKRLYFFAFLLTFGFTASAQWAGLGINLTTEGSTHHSEMKISPTSDGGFYMSWVRLTDVGQIRLDAFDRSGNRRNGWPAEGLVVSKPDGDYWEVEMTHSGDDAVIVVWWGYTTMNTGADRRHVLAQKFDMDGNALWNDGEASKVSTDDWKHHMYPSVISDAAGGVYISWTEWDLNLMPQSNDVYLQRLDADGQPHSGWTAEPKVIANTPSVIESTPNLALSGENLFLQYQIGIVNVSLIMQSIKAADGSFNTGFSVNNGLEITPGPNVYTNAGRVPELYIAPDGDAMLLWMEFRFNGEIYLQKIAADGEIKLGVAGKPIFNNNLEDISFMSSYMDEEGNIIYAWRVAGPAADDYVYANKVNLEGVLQWGTNGFQTTSGTSVYPKVYSDGMGGTFLYYKDIPSSKLHVVRLDEGGNPADGWNMPGPDFGAVGNFNGFHPERDFVGFTTLAGVGNIVFQRKGSDDLYDVYGCNVLYDGSLCEKDFTVFTGTEELGVFENALLTPNPFQESIQLPKRLILVEIYDLQGKLLKFVQQPGSTLNLNDLTNGAYLIRFQNENGNWNSEKVLKQ